MGSKFHRHESQIKESLDNKDELLTTHKIDAAYVRVRYSLTPVLRRRDDSDPKIFQSFSSVPKLEIDAVPGWFVPPHEFDVNASSFSKGSYGSVHRGTWNGTNVVIKSPFLLPKGFIISVRTIKWFIAILSATTSWLTQTEK